MAHTYSRVTPNILNMLRGKKNEQRQISNLNSAGSSYFLLKEQTLERRPKKRDASPSAPTGTDNN